MPSHLTRSVFRRLLANEPIIHRGCLRQRQHSSLPSLDRTARAVTSPNGHLMAWQEQRRTFINFNFFKKREEGSKEADMDPGIEKMMELAKRQRMSARMPPIEEVTAALDNFFLAKSKRDAQMTDTEAQLVLQSLRYYLTALKELEEDGELGQPLPQRSPSLALLSQAWKQVSRTHGQGFSHAHVELAKLLYETVRGFADSRAVLHSLAAYVRALCFTGSAERARELLLEFEMTIQNERAISDIPTPIAEETQSANESTELAEEEDSAQPIPLTGLLGKEWVMVLQGFAFQRNEAEVHHTLQLLNERGFGSHLSVTAVMVRHCLRMDDLDGIRRWWHLYRQQSVQYAGRRPSKLANLFSDVLKWCVEHNELAAGHEFVREVMTTNPPKVMWDAIFVWAAGTRNGVDEIDRMMSVMESSNHSITESSQHRVPNIATINALVAFAISKNDPYMAERFIALGRDRKIEPDARTYVLQMDYRLGVDDVDGALIAYKNLQSMDVSSNEDVPTVNRLIAALCKTSRHDFDTIMNVAADLSDRHVRFEPETVSTLALLHLNRDEHHDVQDLINTHAFHYSSAERHLIRDTIIAFSVDPATPVSRAWSAYSLINSVFDETPRKQRTSLMTAFFNRQRGDMGVRIFQNMHKHSRSDTIPTVDTYVAAFLGLAKLRDLENLEVIHNLLKLDYNIAVNTYLQNALIIAYTACHAPRKALTFFDAIIASKEGPSYNTLHIALRACEKAPFGDLRAREIWALLRQRNVELDHPLWCSYVAALAGNGDVGAAITEVEDAMEKEEVEVDALLLGNLYAGAPGEVKQEEVEGWGKEGFPGAWAELEALGTETDEEGRKRFKIDRRVAP